MNHHRPRIYYIRITVCLLFFALAATASADWPMWRHDGARTANTPEALPNDLTLHWALHLPAPRPAWPAEQGKIRFDASYEPIVAAGRLIVPSMVQDCVTAYATTDGRRLWRFYADGPVRFAPVAHGHHILFASDDGYLYCLAADTGKLEWKFRGGPADRWLLGNDRLISMWPARGAPVTHEDTVYFAAGVWPFMGVFVHAVDIASGKPIWTNSGTGSTYTMQQHNSPAFAGVAPQGYLAVNNDMVLVSGGMTVPAAFDRTTGRLLYYRPGDRQLGKDIGGYEVIIGPGWFVNRGALLQLSDGAPRIRTVINVLDTDSAIGIAGEHLAGFATQVKQATKATTDARGKQKQTVSFNINQQWRARLPEGVTQLHLQAGNDLLVSDDESRLLKLARPQSGDSDCRILWQGQIDGTVWRMLASDGKLFVVSQEGVIYCFGAAGQCPTNGPLAVHDAGSPTNPSAPTREALMPNAIVAQTLAQTPQRDGYAVIEGPNALATAMQLAEQSRFHILIMQPDQERRLQWKNKLAESQLLGTRIALIPGALADTQLPAYFADVVIVQRSSAPLADCAAALKNAYHILRPYTGTAILGGTPATRDAFAKAHEQLEIPGPAKPLKNRLLVTRPGPLPGAGSWTSQNGDAGNTLVAKEHLVKTPLGLLWFGGPSNRDVLPRHGHGPTPQVVGGRLFIEGRDMLRAVDVYTGRLLWQREFKDVGIFYDNTDHHPGAGAIGGNFVTTLDSVYLVWGRRCLRLDPATGETIAEFHLPPDATGENPYWGYLAVSGDHLIAGSTPMLLLTRGPGQKKVKGAAKRDLALYSSFGEGSHRLVVMDRLSGKVAWKRDAHFNFRHNAIAVGDGKLFCIDRMTEKRLAYFRRRGHEPVSQSSLLALDLETGEPIWQSTEDAFGTWLAYEPSSKLLLQAGSKNRDRAEDDLGEGMSVHDATTGQMLWRNDARYGGPPMLYPDKIVTQGKAIDLRTGQPVDRKHPLTGELLPWKFTRNYGCCTAIGCINLLTFRSAAAGYFDLANDGGTGNFGGFRTSCTANLIAADGILSAPDYTRTCTCSYQNQCSVALIHMPDVEMWTFNSIASSSQRVKQLGINFGAPGDRRAQDGTLWLDFPSVGGPSPDVPISVFAAPISGDPISGDPTSSDSTTFTRQHISAVGATAPRWVFASQLHGAHKIRIRLAGADDANASNADADEEDADERDNPAATYRVRLYLAPPDKATMATCRRVRLQDREFELWGTGDVTKSINGLVREFHGIRVNEHLQLEFVLSNNVTGRAAMPIVCGIEISQE